VAIIKTSKGHEILVDDDKYNQLVEYSWNTNTSGYVQARINNKRPLMHRYIFNANKDDVIDHINNNKLDNRMSNLRVSNPPR